MDCKRLEGILDQHPDDRFTDILQGAVFGLVVCLALLVLYTTLGLEVRTVVTIHMAYPWLVLERDPVLNLFFALLAIFVVVSKVVH